MNICFFAGNMGDCGGTEKMTQLLANELCKYEENRIFVLSKTNIKETSVFDLDDRITYSNLDNDRYVRVFSLIKDIFLLIKYIRENKIDILINVDVSLGVFSLPLKILRPQLKQIFWEHFCVLYNINNKRTNKIRKYALKSADEYVVLTPQDKAELAKFCKVKTEIVNIPNICAFDAQNDAYNTESKTIISVGHIINVKGFDMAIDVASKVFSKHSDWCWEIYGTGTEEAKLKERVNALSLEKNLKFMGRADSVSDLYKKSAIYVLTSRSEGFGLVLIEAQAHNLPTVAFDVPFGPQNIIDHGINGYLVEPFDVEKMAECICELIENEELRKSFSDVANKDLYKYKASEIAEQWQTMLNKIK